VELLTDIDNDGEIGGSDSSLAQKAFEQGATEEDIEKGTEYLFVNDDLSNGLWDKDDPDAPSGEKDDDDAQEIAITEPALDEGEVWLDHPAIDALTFYDSRECTTEVPLKPGNRFPLGQQDWPDEIFVRADGNASFPDDNPQITGDLVLKLKVGTEEVEGPKIKLTVVKAFGAEKYFHAAKDYIMENNTTLFADEKSYGSGKDTKLVVMREEATLMRALDSYHHAPSPLFGIDAVVGKYGGATTIINGNWTFDTQNIGFAKNLTRRCHGRLVSNGVYNTDTSSDNDDPNVPAPGHDLRGSLRAGEQYGRYISMVSDKKFEFGSGRVPLDPLPKESLGGLSTNYTAGNQDQIVGIAPVAEEKRVLFTITLTSGSGFTNSIATAAQRSGVEPIDGGDADDFEMLVLDGNTSRALAHENPDGTLDVKVKGLKHNPIPTGYCIHTYLMFVSEKPRQ